MAVPHGESSSASSRNQPQAIDWNFTDDKFHALLSPFQVSLGNSFLDTSEASKLFSEFLYSHLELHGVLRAESKRGNHPAGPHQYRSLVKLTHRLAKKI